MYKISYIGDGVATEFLFSFPFFQNADIHVALNQEILADIEFTVVPDSDFSGGRIIFVDAPADGTRIDIFRQISLSRVIDYQPTLKIDPEHLNTDFNFLLAALHDIQTIDIDLTQWANIHDNVKNFLDYTLSVVEDKLGGGAVLGVYNNLLNVLNDALPQLINDYGLITESAPNENSDDYGVL